MAMKVNELMIGDWVICNHYQDKPFIKQFGVADFAKGEYEFCEPIPLTEEILVKNGFLKRSGKEYYLKDDIVIFVGSDSCEVCTLYGEYTAYSYVEEGYTTIATIHYVHQLQHLLRLCGVEKELIID